MSRRIGCLFAVAIALVGCSKPSKGSSSTGATTTDQAATSVTLEAADAGKPVFAGKKFRDSRGVVKGFGDGRKSIKIAHDDIPDFAKATTTTFPVMAPYVLDGIAEGDRVEFTFSEEFDKSLGGILIHKIQKR
jgi:Cu/Ag efflux protein CusF